MTNFWSTMLQLWILGGFAVWFLFTVGVPGAGEVIAAAVICSTILSFVRELL